MDSSYGRSNNKSSSNNAFDFDLGLSSGRPMNDKKSQTSSYSSSAYNYTSAQPRANTTSYQPNKPTWTHQPAPSTLSGGAGSLSGPPSMVGDIFGKSWNSSASSSSSVSGVGIVNSKNPNLFGDLLTSAMGQNKGTSNVPLKNVGPAASQSTFSMGGMAESLPKTGTNNTAGNVNNFTRSSTGGGDVNLGSNYNRSSSVGAGNVNLSGHDTRNPNLGGPSMKGMVGSGVANKDPFVSLVDFGSKPFGSMKSETKASVKSSSANDPFGDFQNATISSETKGSEKAHFANDPFEDFQNATSKTSTSSFSSSSFPASKSHPLDDFGFLNSHTQSQNQAPVKSSGANDFDTLFSSTSDGVLRGSEEQFLGGDDWGINEEFGGNDTNGTTEIEGLPPPPAGVTVPSAKNKGMDNYKQGQFADAIKWLSWAVVLLERAGDDDGTMEVLTCRASCYKEVGEYKKAVADCTKVLDHDAKNVSVLVQRALLYESMEKYKLGAEDLRTVMTLDPSNRLARSTIHRLTKMAEVCVC